MQLPAKPFYGVDGNLLVEDLPHPHEDVEAVLNGTFKPRFWAEQLLTPILYAKHPQLADEYWKRKHRREYRAKLEAKRQRRSPPSEHR